MRSTSKGWTAIAAVALTALMLIATPAAAASPITVSGYSLNGSIVMVTVKNTSSSPVVGTVAVQAKVGGLSVFSLAPVSLSGNQTATVGVAFVGSVGKILSVGVTDDQMPI
jgi:hypothetical protein